MEERKTSFNDLFCIRCGRPATGRYLFDDCPFCREEGVSANYSARIPLPAAVSGSFPVESNQPGIWKYRALYAVSSKVSPVSLEEGQTDYVNEETDRLFKEAGSNLNVEEREAQYQRIQDIVAEELPHIPLVQIKAVYGVAGNIEFLPPLNENIRVTDIHRK